MAATVNLVVLGGTVFKVFDARQTQSGLANQSFVLSYTENDRDKRIVVNAFGDLAEVIGDLEEGNRVLVQGRLSEQNWQDDDKEWHSRTDVILSKLVDLDADEEDGPPDE